LPVLTTFSPIPDGAARGRRWSVRRCLSMQSGAALRYERCHHLVLNRSFQPASQV